MFGLSAVHMYFSSTIRIKNVQIFKNQQFCNVFINNPDLDPNRDLKLRLKLDPNPKLRLNPDPKKLFRIRITV
jgi:hypothetical protein